MNIKYKLEYEIDTKAQQEIAELLQFTFKEVNYNNRSYFKQLPHSRLLAYINEELVGHLAIDYRAMNMNGEAVKVFGVIDLCVKQSIQNKGIGKQLLNELDKIAFQNKHNIDFIFLVTESPEYYENLGYQKIDSTISWLKLHQHNNYGVGKEKIDDCFFLVKAISGIAWQNGDLDMLGYMY